jgi:perosamine synthetase
MSLAWRFDEKERNYINEVLNSGFCSSTCGGMNTLFERKFAEIIGRPLCISFNSGTTTLHASLRALGVGYGDEVIIPCLTVISCMNVVLYCNAVPVFADIDPDTFCIDPDDIERKITERTKAIMPVHLYGTVANMTRIMEIAKKHNLAVVEDCAQCYLGTHKGKYGGTFGDVGSWSMENSKHITTGDGGMIACDDEDLGDKIRKLNCQGYKKATAITGKIRSGKDVFRDPTYKRHSCLGYMFRLPETSAAMALGQLEKIDWFVGLRKQMALIYKEAIGNCDWLVPQKVIDGESSYYTYALKFMRDDVTWQEFNAKYMENGGDGIYSAWVPLYKEDSIDDCKRFLQEIGLGSRIKTFDTVCPMAESIQGELMQLTTNQKDIADMTVQAEAMVKTIKYFN